MAKWVSNLCSVCGFKQEESPTGIPEPKKQAPTQNGKAPVVSARSVNPTSRTSMTRVPVVTQPSKPPSIPSTTQTSTLSSHLSTSESYIPLQECSTGSNRADRQSPIDRRESVDSVPDELAPPPPLKTGHQSPSPRNSNEVFSDLYSVPPPTKQTHISFDQFYLVPPSHGQRNSDSEFHHDLTYDVPPRRGSPSTPRSSSSGCTDSTLSSGRPVTPQDMILPTYDTPPIRSACRQSSPPPPSRPPRPITSNYPQNDYQNLPTPRNTMGNTDLNAIIPTPSKNERPLVFDSYDIPRSNPVLNNRESNINLVPAAPKPCKGNKHSYINAAAGYIPTNDDMYLSMDQGGGRATTDSTYTDMLATPPVPAPRPPETLNNNDLYVSPPPSSRSLPRPPGVIHRPAIPPTDDTYSIWSNTRTKSFKRHQNGTSNGRPVVPHKSPAIQLPRRDGDISSDDEGLNSLHKVCGVQSIPPPPGEDKELKYLDLALEETTDKDSVHMKSLPSKNLSNQTPTEYREIDFVKTQALSNTKKWGDDQRLHEKNEKMEKERLEREKMEKSK